MKWHIVWQFVLNNKIVLGLVATAGISTMPPPGSPINWRTLYTWLYDWLHQFPNIKPSVKDPDKPKPQP